MKRCPTCNRTFEDTFTFCLVDGSVLSAPFDPDATKLPRESGGDNAPLTEVLPSDSGSGSLAATLVSPAETPAATANASDIRGSEPDELEVSETSDSRKRGGLPLILGWVIISGFIFLVLGGLGNQRQVTTIGMFIFAGGVMALLITAMMKRSSDSK
jgi:hypothetical protein